MSCLDHIINKELFNNCSNCSNNGEYLKYCYNCFSVTPIILAPYYPVIKDKHSEHVLLFKNTVTNLTDKDLNNIVFNK